MRIVVAGGGLVGLTVARLLRAHESAPQVIERMAAGRYVKRGFMLGQQGHDALAELGLLDAVRSAGRPIGAQPDGSVAAIAVEVGRVLSLLGEGLSVHHEHSVTGLREDGGRVVGVEVEGPEGSRTVECDLVVACDGFRSRVRSMAGLQADVAPLAEGKIEWMSPVPVERSFGMEYLSDGGHIGLISWPEGSFGWRTTDRVGREACLAPGIEALKESWSRLLPEAAAGVAGLTSMDDVFYSEPALLTCPEWWRPGVVLVGDAAHFFGPETGASAGIGMADAHALARAIATHPDDPDEACRAYEAWRGPAVRPYEAGDPSRMRLEGASIPSAAPDERWPPAA